MRSLFVVCSWVIAVAAHADDPKAKTIPVAMYNSAGASGNGPKMLEDYLHANTEFRITRITAEEIRAGKLKGYQALIVPGGTSSTQGNTLGEDGREKIREFVRDGGSYLGLCAGCYLASKHYKWSLGILPVKVVDSANWERGRAELKIELTQDGQKWLPRNEVTPKTLYHNGPVLKVDQGAEKQVVSLAFFREEITRKDAKKGLMVDTPAIAAAPYGHGWAIGISPHPEQTEGLKDIVPSALRYALKQSELKK